MKITVRLAMLGSSSRKPIKGELEVMGPCDTGSIVTTVTGAIIGKMSRVLAVGGIEIEVEPSVYEHYQKQGWKDAY